MRRLIIISLLIHDASSCDIPRTALRAWLADHTPDERPDTPIIFEPSDDERFPMPSWLSFMHDFSDEAVDTQPGYAQAGGHLNMIWPLSRIGEKAPLRDIVSRWNSSLYGYYHSEFNCRSHICQRFTHEVRPVHLQSFHAIRNPDARVNFLVGGVGSGLPFHRHAETWQTLLNGRKAWYLVPPGHMHSALASAVGPFLYPPAAWGRRVSRSPLGHLRPLRCVQHRRSNEKSLELLPFFHFGFGYSTLTFGHCDALLLSSRRGNQPTQLASS